MNLSCSARMIKYLMFIFNLFFVITGITLIAVGTTVKTIYTDYSYFLNDHYFSLPNMLIATGVIIFFISFFGCCGALKENWILLGIFSILLIIIFIFEFSAGIAGYVLRDKTANYIDSALRENLPNYENETHAIWDLIQSNFECCGVDSPDDWKVAFNYSLPLSCCPAKTGTVGVFYCNSYVPGTTAATQSTVTTSTNITNPTETTTVSSTTATTTTVSSTTATNTTVGSTTATTATTVSPNPTTNNTVTPNSTASISANPPESANSRKRRALEDGPVQPAVNNATTTIAPDTTSTPYHTGCKSAFGDYIRKHAVQIGGCAMGLAVVQLLGIFFSCHLVRQLKNGYYST